MNKTILVVDDEEMTRDLLRIMLKAGGFNILEAVDGSDALAKVKAQIPDLMILDVMMPGLDGLTVCRLLREQPETADLPIIMLSAKTSRDAVQDGLAAGANKYLTKPVGFKELISNIQEILGEIVTSQ